MNRRKATTFFSSNQETIFFITVPVIDLIFLYFVKYSTYGLSLSDFDLFVFGNFLNFLCCFFILFFVLFLRIMHYDRLKKSSNVISFLLVAGNIFLASAGTLSLTGFTTGNFYIFKTPAARVILGFLFSGYQLLLFFLIFYLWFRVTDKKSYIFLRVISAGIALSFCLFSIAMIYSQAGIESDEAYIKISKPMDCTVVLGAAVWSGNKPSDILKLRLQKGVELYWGKHTKKIQLTGSNAPGELSEAEVARIYIKQFSVNSDDIWTEMKTTSTVEQINYIKEELKGLKKLKRIAIVSDRFHIARVKEIARFFNTDVFMVATDMDMQPTQKVYYTIREAVSLMNFWLFAIR